MWRVEVSEGCNFHEFEFMKHIGGKIKTIPGMGIGMWGCLYQGRGW